jgi:DNA topoisomerase-1
MAGIGRFGPYVQHAKTYANIEVGDDVLTIGLNRAVTLIEEKKLKPGKGRRFGADPGRPLGEHPDKGGPIVVKNGRYGPYVSHDGVNATLPADKTPEAITLDEAVVLIDARAARGDGGGRSRKKPAAKPSPVAKKKAAAADATAAKPAPRKPRKAAATARAPAKPAAPPETKKPPRKAKSAK